MHDVAIFLISNSLNTGTHQYSMTFVSLLAQLGRAHNKKFVIFFDDEQLRADFIDSPCLNFVRINRFELRSIQILRLIMLFIFGRSPRFLMGRYKVLLNYPAKEAIALTPVAPALLYRKLSFVIHDCEFLPGRLKDMRLSETLIRSIVNFRFAIQASRIFVESESTAHDVMRYFRVPSEKIKIMNTGPGLGLQLEQTRQRFRRSRPKARGSGFFITSPGFHSISKNQIVVLNACKILVGRGFPVYLSLAGPKTEYTRVLSNFIEENELGAYVEVPGLLTDDELLNLYSRADLVVMPSLMGPTNMPVYEGLCMFKPVLVSRIGEMPLQVGMCERLIFSAEDGLDLANKIEWLISSSKNYSSLNTLISELRNEILFGERSIESVLKREIF